MKKRLIEWNLPLADISDESAREKNIRHGHPSTLHIWWARRPLAASRATIFSALVDDPGPDELAPEGSGFSTQRDYLQDLIVRISPWKIGKGNITGPIDEAYKLIKTQYKGSPNLLDPFSGGGSIPLEALRLGCSTFAIDYNPVAVLIEMATLNWPQKFGIDIELPKQIIDGKRQSNSQLSFSSNGKNRKVNLLAFLVEKWTNIIFDEAKEEISQFYPKESGINLFLEKHIEKDNFWTPVGYIWARTIPCQNPSCGANIPLIKQFWLSKKKNKKIAYRPIVIVENKSINFELLENFKRISEVNFDPSEGTVNRGNTRCPICGQITKAKYVRELAKKGLMSERLLIVVLNNAKVGGKKYRLATKQDEMLFKQATDLLDEKIANWSFLGSPIPSEEIPYNSRYLTPSVYGFKQWGELFNDRQKLEIITLIEKLKLNYENIIDYCEKILSLAHVEKFQAKELAKAIMGYISLIISRHSSYNSNVCWWEPIGERSFNIFGRPAISIAWDYSEQNPFEILTGNWESQRDLTVEIINQLSFNLNADSNIWMGSATKIDIPSNTIDAIITDPPYYDNVPYSVLSDFFYVWLKRILDEVFPDLFSTPLVNKSDEIIMEPSRHKTKQEAIKFFEEKLSFSFKEMYRILKDGGIAVIVYAHKSTKGWETMLNGLLESGFVVTSSWPIHTEMKTRLRASSSAALASSIYMVCRKYKKERIGYWNEIQNKIKNNVEGKLIQFWDEGISGGDFFISAIGPGMEEYSKYEQVETFSGDVVEWSSY